MSDDRVKHILVPVDTETIEVSGKALRRAVAIARTDGARLTLMTVMPAWREDLSDEVPEEITTALATAIATHAEGIDVETLVKIGGSISGRIIQAVEETQCDMVVMASHNPRMTDFLIGSNAAHVALHVPCTVMVVR
jgi:nucleotide-binding universal stress UspA family protein